MNNREKCDGRQEVKDDNGERDYEAKRQCMVKNKHVTMGKERCMTCDTRWIDEGYS